MGDDATRGARRPARTRWDGGTRVVSLLALLGLIVVFAAGCGPRAHRGAEAEREWASDFARGELDGDLDMAEARWRVALADDPWEDTRLLADDPPRNPASYGKVAFRDDAGDGVEAVEEPPRDFWARVKKNADTVGKVSFAAMSVMVTVGMAVAPYLLL